jgi:glycosyltransferase involved in cell wall biosynthesis
MKKTPFISICILSYNRPETLERLLKTIDTQNIEEIEVVICEDASPRRTEIRLVVDNFSLQRAYPVRYFENEKNLGYDGTFNQLCRHAQGEWMVFMGDDDEFAPLALDKMIDFLQNHSELGYVMKSHYLLHESREKEIFRYFKGTKFFPAGLDTYTTLFRRSVFIAGFTIRREYALPFLTDRFDGTMLMQLYLLAEVVLKHPSAYFDEPFTQQYASHAHNTGDVMFDRDKKKFIPRRPTLDISLKFLKSFSDITQYIDNKYDVDSTKRIKHDMSKYFYPSLSIYRESGIVFFMQYVRHLNKLGFNTSIYYYIYVVMLACFGRKFCNWGIYWLKRLLGYTPQL